MLEADPKTVVRAVEILRQGGLVAIPTETVYGLAADAENELAVRRIFATKGRPQSHPLIVHLADPAKLSDGWAREVPEAAHKLAEALWPGPLTLVLSRGPRALDVVTGGQDTVALRVPKHPVARAILSEFGGGLAAPSANRFGRTSPTLAAHVTQDLGKDVDLIVDGGPCEVGVESTIVDVSQGAVALLRPGGVPREELERVLGGPIAIRSEATSAVRAPGMLQSHYAPRAGVVLSTEEKAADEAKRLARGGQRVAVMAPARELPGGIGLLEVPADPAGMARVLYATLREADARGYDVVVVQLPPEGGLGLAVQDRLRRAAAPRS